jgi:hypothetical protein
VDLAQALALAQLAEQHRHKLPPTTESLAPALCAVRSDERLELATG